MLPSIQGHKTVPPNKSYKITFPHAHPSFFPQPLESLNPSHPPIEAKRCYLALSALRKYQLMNYRWIPNTIPISYVNYKPPEHANSCIYKYDLHV